MADPIVTQQVFQVEHVKIESTKKFAEVEAALDAAIPQLDPAIGAALTNCLSGFPSPDPRRRSKDKSRVIEATTKGPSERFTARGSFASA